MCVIIVIISLVLSHTVFGSLDRFLFDLKYKFGTMKSALISHNCEHFTRITTTLPNSYLCYSNISEPQEVAQHIKWLRKLNQLEIIIVMEDDHNTLTQILDRETDLFHSSVTCLLSGYPSANLTLRLDSRLFYYQSHENDSFALFELYAIKGGPSIDRQIGLWSPHQGLVMPTPNIWDRRANLLGTKLKSTTMPFSLLTIFHYDSNGAVANITGLLPDLFYSLGETLNYTAYTEMPTDGKWGSYVKERSAWNGMVGMLINGETDIVTAGLTQTVEREKAICFTIPVQYDTITLIAPQEEGHAPQFWVYTHIFSINSWIALTGIIMATCLGFFVLSGVNYFHKSDDSEEFSIENSVALSILMLYQLSYDVVIKQMSARVLFFVASIMTYFIFAYYTSDLTARMTSGPPSTPIRSFQDVLERKYKVIVHEFTSNHELLKTATPNSAMYELYWSQMNGNPDSFVRSSREGLDKVLTEEKTLLYSPAFAAFGDPRYVTLNLNEKIFTNIGWGFSNNSEFVEYFNHHMHKMQQSGSMNRLDRQWKYLANEDFGFPDAVSLGFNQALFPYLVLLGGMCMALCLAPYEKLMNAMHMKKKTQGAMEIEHSRMSVNVMSTTALHSVSES
jgi:ABC-type amino acid transport substrate-binding protein